jgi:hypothetical protein
MTSLEACELSVDATRQLSIARTDREMLLLLAQKLAARASTVAKERDTYKRRYFELLDRQRAERQQVITGNNLPDASEAA